MGRGLVPRACTDKHSSSCQIAITCNGQYDRHVMKPQPSTICKFKGISFCRPLGVQIWQKRVACYAHYSQTTYKRTHGSGYKTTPKTRCNWCKQLFTFRTVMISIPYILHNVPSGSPALTISFCTALVFFVIVYLRMLSSCCTIHQGINIITNSVECTGKMCCTRGHHAIISTL